MLHWYVAQGWSRQHHYQRVMLCRVRDFELAQVVVDVIKDSLRICHWSVRSLNKDEAECRKMRSLWDLSYTHHSSQSIIPDIPSCKDDPTKAAKDGKRFDDCVAFLKVLADGILDWKFCSEMHTVLSNVTCKARELNGEATPAQAGVASASRNTPEPIVDYRHETQQGRVPPGQVSLLGMQGRLPGGDLAMFRTHSQQRRTKKIRYPEKSTLFCKTWISKTR